MIAPRVYWFPRLLLRWATPIALVGLLLGGGSAYFTAKLFLNLRTDIEELLPSTARSVLDLNEVGSRLKSIDSLAILALDDQDVMASRRFVDDLAAALSQRRDDGIAGVEYRIQNEIQFFRERGALFFQNSDLVKIREYLQTRIQYERDVRNPLNIFSQVSLDEPKFDFGGLRLKYGAKTSAYSRFPDGYYATPDQKKRVILVHLAGKASAVGQALKLKQAVDEEIARLDPSQYSPTLQIKFTGGIQQVLEEHEALIEDLGLSTLIVTVLVVLSMWIFFRSALATASLILSLFIGTFVTFTFAFFTVGYLNANSAFLGSIVIGNGINFGIILLARYVEERRKGLGHPRAVYISVTRTASATFIAALAAGISYGSLMLTGFRGFSQFGAIGLAGMIFCWLAAYLFIPTLLTVLERFSTPLIRPVRLSRRKRSRLGIFRHGPAARLLWTVQTWPGTIVLLTTLASIAAGVTIAAKAPSDPTKMIEMDLTRLRNKDSINFGALALSDVLDEIFQRFLSPLVILPDDRDQGRKIAQVLRKQMELDGPDGLIAGVQTIDDFVPVGQREKISVLNEIRELLPPKLLKHLSPENRAEIRDFLNPKVFQTFKDTDLPPMILEKFTEQDGSVGKLVVLEPTMSKVTRQGPVLIGFVKKVRELVDSVAPGTPVAANQAVTADMLEAVMRDGPQATLFAFGAVLILLILLFRNLRTISLAVFALGLGIFWLVGLVFGFDLKINFLNFIALPITFGIGVDYGVNIFQRYRSDRRANIRATVRNTGGAVTLCSWTTIIGYGSLLIARNQAFVSFGLLAVLGEITCLLAAVIALPSLILFFGKRKPTQASVEPLKVD